MPEGADLLQHLTYMTSLAEQLREMEEDISPRKFATVVLGSLPESYDNFLTSLLPTSVNLGRILKTDYFEYLIIRFDYLIIG